MAFGSAFAKRGGFVMPLNSFGFYKRDMPATSDEIVTASDRHHRHAIDSFGVNPYMFEIYHEIDYSIA